MINELTIIIKNYSVPFSVLPLHYSAILQFKLQLIFKKIIIEENRISTIALSEECNMHSKGDRPIMI